MTTRAPFLMTLTALVLAACAMALGPPGAGRAPQAGIAGAAGSQPFACALVAQARGGTRLEARIEARQALSASYALRVRGAGVAIDQGGDLSLRAGESALLGEAEVSTPLSALDARLTVTAGGRSVACPLQGS